MEYICAGCDLGCHIGCDLHTEVTPRAIPLFIGVTRVVGCDVGTFSKIKKLSAFLVVDFTSISPKVEFLHHKTKKINILWLYLKNYA